MMFINAFAAAITLISPAVFAAPQIPQDLLKIKLCQDPDLGGLCLEPVARVATCENIDPTYDDKVTSFDTRGRICTFYLEADCYAATEYSYDGTMNDLLKSERPGFNDAISSYNCL
ncbi:uncharacterized protein L3040_005225 [Drepanopeziza brunnea f. sp. 'multigermtubi']|uniref:Uncharacterized protein n=1 Tax=Marssonina brunnea f. sp. multigermtubi (strain MB_m1) TaxID=1072389 RepID=K1W6P9_MARBU|nr:uncharacterized protein MBM_09209 [Drepanopeziza brunnea f. sp. 'multigermtubi' MB_m1]EKD12640.1 hypothetical protein MBM_09209 [Drepanopeziza brunnea f. sp. 'multigermtubi' MB_m1]KAJ5041647.1 hypothetical protein L3040_005225 [Drepanopeziza brunnea f. sp. 'multigermtubi']